MNRKIIIAAIGFVIAVAIGLHFYAEWQMAKFDASLPTPPAEEEQQRIDETADDTAGDTSGGHWHGDEWHAEPHEVQNDGDEGITIGDPSKGVTITADEDISELLTDSEVEALNEKIRRGDVHRHPEKLSQREIEYLSVVGIDLSMVPPDIRRQRLQEIDRQFYGQFGLKPPPEGYSFSFSDLDKGILNLDENGMPIVFNDRTGRDVPWAEVSAHFEGDPYVEK